MLEPTGVRRRTVLVLHPSFEAAVRAHCQHRVRLSYARQDAYDAVHPYTPAMPAGPVETSVTATQK